MRTLEEEDRELDLYLQLVEELAAESGCDMAEVAAASAYLAHEDKTPVVPLEPGAELVPIAEDGMVRLFVDAGRREGVRPGDIVGAIANEAGIPGKAIGAIDIYDHFTYVDVPSEYREQVLQGMSGATIRRRQANIRLATAGDEPAGAPRNDRRGQRKGRRRQRN